MATECMYVQSDVVLSQHNIGKKRASVYDQEIPQSHTADQPMAP